MPPITLELLAPAKDCATGIAAIDHGADAVYIGAPRFSARADAGNPIDEIRRLAGYAHQFHARVYVALNTLLRDDELEEAVAIAHQVYEAGVDALIIQDMGLLECDLPPLPLHASTQCDNRSPEKVKFLEDVGFAQVVLARELSLKQIRDIRQATTVPLEFFVHGALCVCFSGRCFISEVMAGRSANRGECAQFCRHRYTLKDGAGHVLQKDSHLLCLQDLDLSAHLRQLVGAGITSFKIEGRLKDINYVKNVTAFYRTALDAIIDADGDLQRASSGRCTFAFTPDPARTFHRGATDYFLTTPRNRPGALQTPKSTGLQIGRVRKAHPDFLEIEARIAIANGDGLCFFTPDGALVGLRVNRVDGARIFPKDRVHIPPGTVLFRNHDISFLKQLGISDKCRKISVSVTIAETANGLCCTVVDEDGCRSSIEYEIMKEEARNHGKMRDTLIQQVKKSGNTIFSVNRVDVTVDTMPHLSTARLNDMRRRALDAHLQVRLDQHIIHYRALAPSSSPWRSGQSAVADHITNRRALDFFRRHGISDLGGKGPGARKSTILMTCKYCLKAQLGLCPALGRQARKLAEPLTITDNTGVYELAFDCKQCQMSVLLQHPKK